MNNGLRRLKVLVKEVLPRVKEENFSLSVWICGSVACAAGHAAKYKPFQKEGLSLTKGVIPYPLYKNKIAENAVAEFFELSDEEVEALFYEDYYIGGKTVRDVIAKIEEVIKEKEDDKNGEKEFKETGGTN